MANVYWHLGELTGSTLALRLYPEASGTIANTGGDLMTEGAGGLFQATVGESMSLWHKAYADRVALFTVDTSTDVITSNSHGRSDGTVVVFQASGSLPSPLVAGTTYYVRDSTSNTFKVAATLGGSAINLTSDGTGGFWFHSAIPVVATGWVDMTNGSQVINESRIDLSAFPPAVVVGRYTDDDADSPNINCKIGELGVVKAVSVTDSDGDAVDLTDWGDKVLVIERAKPRTDVQVIENGDITITGVSNQTFSFQPSSTVLAQPGDYIWSLREVSSGDVIIDGRLSVAYSPLEDTP